MTTNNPSNVLFRLKKVKSLFSKGTSRHKSSITGIVLLCCILFLTIFGAVMVYSASMYSAKRTYGNEYFFLFKQIIGIVLGLFCLILMSKVDYNKLSKYAFPLLLVSFVLLLLVFIPGIGVENYGARRWLRLPGTTIQPSEIAKFSFVLFASSYLSKHSASVKHFGTLIPVLLAGLMTCLLIFLEPNMSITICVGLLLVTMLFVGGLSFRHFVLLAIPALIGLPLLVLMEPYRLLRLLAFINPWASPKGEGYQLIQSLFSISSGGLLGVGLFNSRQKYLFLPFAESDFIFSIIAEELGLLGSLIILAIYFAIIVCGIKIALSAKDRFGCYLASGITAVIAIQTLLNIAVVTGLVPPTGLPLPFISAGSTSLVVFMSAIGVVLNVNKQSKSRV